MRRSTGRGAGRQWAAAVALIGVLLASGAAGAARGQAQPRARQAAASGPWTIGGGPPGPVEALLALPSGSGLPAELIAGGTGRVAVSSDGGSSWHSAYDGGSIAGSVTALLAIGSGPAAPILAGTTAGLFRSLDRGLHWTRARGGLPTTTGVEVLAQSGDTVFAGTGDQSASGAFNGSGLFASRDGGLTWTPMTLPAGAGPFVSAVLAHNGTLYVGTVGGSASALTGHLYARLPGQAFHLSDAGLSSKVRVHALAMGRATLVAGTGAGFYVSGDGAHWKAAEQGGLRPFIYTVVRDPGRAQVLYGGSLGSGMDDPGAGIWQSGDGGQTWHPSSLGVPTYMDIHAIAVVAQPGKAAAYYAAADGVWRSRDALHWSPASNGLNFGAIRVLLADPMHPGTLVAGSSYSGFYRSTDGGRSWKVANQGLLNNEPLALASGGSGSLYAATDGQVVRWDASAGTWKALDSHLNRRRALTAFALGRVPGAVDILYVAGAFGGPRTFALYRSTTLGRAWTAITVPGTGGSPIRHLAVAVTNPNLVYAATDTALFVSGNGGTTWAPTGPPTSKSTIITALALDPASSQTAYVAIVAVDRNALSAATSLTGATVYRTVDGGGRWTAVRHYGAGTLILQVRAALPTLVVGARLTGQRVLAVVDEQSGGLWRSLAAGLPDEVYGNAVDTDGVRLYLGTGEHGVWTRLFAGGPAPSGGGPRGSGPTPTPVIPGA